ncbi:probable 6-phosphogluconolactonase 4, chloroplastic [Phalaenopsis equestris]|uniref:probable 6-phosphogluconolactonase 4, chloroplastic n=1 Tax=Phalaenopsis equestris TaxID=78828 RepID=UPI0009E504ED|nr:probable 6-phosphogluconolactonase 4, chloroplastic [Phalaenopsis equestris]
MPLSLSSPVVSSHHRLFPPAPTFDHPAILRSYRPFQPLRTTATFSSFQLRRRSTSNLMASWTTPGAATKGGSELLVFESEEELSDSLAKYTADLSKKFCLERGDFTVVLSGGSLVKSLRKLVESPYAESIDWGKWHVFWADERVVPKDHPDSNYKLAFDGFLSKVPIPTDQLYAINDSLSAEAAAEDYETRLKHLINKGVVLLSQPKGFPKFDLLLLGMGPDGHIASLFPGHSLLSENERWVAFINDSPKPPPERITFTFPVINSSANVALVVAGSGKADVVHQVFGSTNSSSGLLPVQLVKPDDGALTWFTDKAAASKL